MKGKPRTTVARHLVPCLMCGLFCTLAASQVHAQLCSDIFADLTDPSLSCADTFYFVDGPGGATRMDEFEGSDTGLLATEFDGFDLFDPEDIELEPPDNLLEPFFSDIQYNQTNIGGKINSFQARHRGGAAMEVRDSAFQRATYGTRSVVTFVPFTNDGSSDPVTIKLDFDFDFTLADPLDNATPGASFAGAGAQIFDPDDPLGPLFDFSGLAELDLDFEGDEPDFFGDFDGPESRFTPSGPGIVDEFDFDVEFDATISSAPGKPLKLDTDTFGSIFTDGFESGDTSAWSSSSGDTFKITISSPDPNVRFRLVLGPPENPSLSRIHRFTSFDSDGKDDLLLRNKDSGKWQINFMNWRLVKPNSGPTSLFTSLDWEFVGTGDFNGDGRGDILLRNRQTGGWWMFLMNGRSKVSGAVMITKNRDWDAATVGDFDGDGKDDIMLRHRIFGRWQIKFMKFRQVQGDSGFTPLFNSLRWELMGTGDFNKDGKQDVLLRNKDTDAWWIYLMDGLNRTGGMTALFKNDDWTIAGIDDFDGDGCDDVLLRNRKTGRWYIFFMNSMAVKPGSGFTPLMTDRDWEMQGTGDFNKDGKADIALRNKQTGEWWIYLMNGRTPNSGATAVTKDLAWMTPAIENK